MALSQYQQGDPSASGDFAKRIEYNSKAGRAYRVDRVETPAGWETVKTELQMPFGVAIDLEDIEVGWAHFAAGSAPSFQFVKLRDLITQTATYPARPSDQHQESFRVRVWNSDVLGDDPREFSSTAKAVRVPFDLLHDQWTAEKDQNPGKVPWVVFTGVNAETNKHGTNYAPVFQITDWVDASVFVRATEAPPIAATAPAVQAAPPPAPPQAPVAAPPPPPAPPQPPAAGAPEFGPPAA